MMLQIIKKISEEFYNDDEDDEYDNEDENNNEDQHYQISDIYHSEGDYNDKYEKEGNGDEMAMMVMKVTMMEIII